MAIGMNSDEPANLHRIVLDQIRLTALRRVIPSEEGGSKMIRETRRTNQRVNRVVCISFIVALVFTPAPGWSQVLRSGTYRVETTAEDGQRYASTWRLRVEKNRIKGESEWDCCPGHRIDPLVGRIEGDRVIIERQCHGQGLRDRCHQVYEGRIHGNVIEGSFTHNGAYGGRWTLYVWDSEDDWSHHQVDRRSISQEAISKTIAKLEDLSDEIEKDIEKLTKKGRHDPLLVQLEAELQAFENACDELEREFKKEKKDPWAVEAEVRSVLDRGRRINLLISPSNVANEVRQDWTEIRVRLDLLADAYGLRRIG